MERLNPKYTFKIDRVDAMLVCALVVVLSSYAAGYKLDWSQLDAPAVANAGASAQAAVAADDEEESDAQDARAATEEPPSIAAPLAQAAAPAPASVAIDPKDAAWKEMTDELQRLASNHHGRVAVYVKDMREGRTWTYHENDLFPSASLIKLPIMAAVFAKMKDGGTSLHERLTLHRHNRIGGSGSLKWSADGTRFTVSELLQRMIHESDNTATNMLIEHVGLGYIQRQLPSFGLLYTGIYQEGMSIKSGRVQNENYTTAREMSMLMEKVYLGQLVDRPSSMMMMEILKHKKAVASRLAKSLPRNWEIAHKTGLLRNACHDVAIILSPNGDYAITVLTGSNQSYKAAKDFITRLGRVTYAHYGGYPQYYASSRKHGRQLARR